MGGTIQLLFRTLRVGCYPYLNQRLDNEIKPYQSPGFTPRYHRCRCRRFAEEMAGLVVIQMEKAHAIINTFSFEVLHIGALIFEVC